MGKTKASGGLMAAAVVALLGCAGGLGAVFGVGAASQTYVTTDGGQFREAVTAYVAKPTLLP